MSPTPPFTPKSVAETVTLWREAFSPDQKGVFSVSGISGTGKSSAISATAEDLARAGIQVAPEGMVYTDQISRLILSLPAGQPLPETLEHRGWNNGSGLVRGNSLERVEAAVSDRYGPQMAGEIAKHACSLAFGSWDFVHQLAPQYPRSAPAEARKSFAETLAARFLHQQVIPVFWMNPKLVTEDLRCFSPLEDPRPQMEFLTAVQQRHSAPTHDDILEADIPGLDAEMDGRYNRLCSQLPAEPTIVLTAHNIPKETYQRIMAATVETVKRLRSTRRESGDLILGETPIRRHDFQYWVSSTSLSAHPSQNPRSARAKFCSTPEFVNLRTVQPHNGTVLQFAQANHFVHLEFAIRAAVVEGALRSERVPYSILWPVKNSEHALLYPHAVFTWTPDHGMARWSPEQERSIFKGSAS